MVMRISFRGNLEIFTFKQGIILGNKTAGNYGATSKWQENYSQSFFLVKFLKEEFLFSNWTFITTTTTIIIDEVHTTSPWVIRMSLGRRGSSLVTLFSLGSGGEGCSWRFLLSHTSRLWHKWSFFFSQVRACMFPTWHGTKDMESFRLK